MDYKIALLKQKCESIIISPIVMLGKIWGLIAPLKKTTSVFLFFPSADLGGSVKVNADIAHCVKDKNPLIIFSKKPKNNGFKKLFEEFDVMDLHKKIDHKLYHFVNIFYRGVLAAWINRADDPVVFGGECLFFYKMLPHLKKKVRRIELCHLDTWFPYSIGFIEMITERVFSTLKLKEKVAAQYEKQNADQKFYDHLHFIENKIDIPAYQETRNQNLEVIFVGRGAPQKRVYLIAAIAREMHEKNDPAHFSFIGDVENEIPHDSFPYCTFYGNVRDEDKLNSIYQNADVLILTSSYEGLPIVVMQMMAYGKVVLSTAVNAIPDYIKHMGNGLLIKSTEENEIVNEGVRLLELLIEKPALKNELGEKSRKIAIEKFNGELFCREYQKILFNQ